MPHETSPLLSKNDDCMEYGLPTKTGTSIYDRFTPQRRRMILVLISLAGMIPREYPASALAMYRSPLWLTLCMWLSFTVFVIGSFVPCIPQISRDLRTTGTVIK